MIRSFWIPGCVPNVLHHYSFQLGSYKYINSKKASTKLKALKIIQDMDTDVKI